VVATLYNAKLSQLVPQKAPPPPLDVWPFRKTILSPLLARRDVLIITISRITNNTINTNTL